VDELLIATNARALLQPLPETDVHRSRRHCLHVRVDRARNAASLIQSIYYPFGSAFVGGHRVLLHNRGHYFSSILRRQRADAGNGASHADCVGRSGRGRPWIVWGTMGADGQPRRSFSTPSRADRQPPPGGCIAPRSSAADSSSRIATTASLRGGHRAMCSSACESVDTTCLSAPLDEMMGHAHAIVIHTTAGSRRAATRGATVGPSCSRMSQDTAISPFVLEIIQTASSRSATRCSTHAAHESEHDHLRGAGPRRRPDDAGGR